MKMKIWMRTVERSDGPIYFSPEIILILCTKVRTESLRKIYSYINEKKLRTSQSERDTLRTNKKKEKKELQKRRRRKKRTEKRYIATLYTTV